MSVPLRGMSQTTIALALPDSALTHSQKVMSEGLEYLVLIIY